eukprot:1007423-Prorocentrum_lima.AAC.1
MAAARLLAPPCATPVPSDLRPGAKAAAPPLVLPPPRRGDIAWKASSWLSSWPILSASALSLRTRP